MMSWIIAILFLVFAGLVIYVFFSKPSLPPQTDAIISDVINGELPEVIVGKSGIVSSGGIDIWYESIVPAGPSKGTVLLLMAMGGDALFWPPEFVRAFVEAGYRVIRYDQRGTGMSDWITNWDSKNPYSLADMAEDVIAVLNALGINKAHLVGLSMGGMIAQEVAIKHPDRVASLTLMMTSGFIGDPELPGLSSRYVWHSLLHGLPLFKYRILGGEKNLIRERIAKTISVIGDQGLDIKELAELVLYDLRKRRGVNLKAPLQHQAAVTIAGSRYQKLKTLDIPTLVIHGTDDQFIPVGHGRKLAEIIPHARSVWLDGIGHVFPVPDMDGLMSNIFAHFEKK
jgi:pimeloyl-ACP methyl ester carboxylesterase